MGYKGVKIKVGERIYDTAEEYKLYIKDFPFIPVASEQKNIFSQSWYDENGDDTYIPQEAYFSPIKLSLSFVYVGLLHDCISNIRSFIADIRNKEFSIYDTYSLQGRQKCLLENVSESANILRYKDTADTDANQQVCAEFTMEIKINDPVTQITL